MKLYNPRTELHQEGWKLEPISNREWVASKVIQMKNGEGIVFVGEKDVWFYVKNFKPIKDIEGLSEEDLEERKAYLVKDRYITLYHDDYVDIITFKQIADAMWNLRQLKYE